MKSPTQPSGLFRAFADATRLRILNLLLEQKEICVCDLCEVLDEIQPKVSRHLATLRRVGLVHYRSEGKWKHYSITDHPSRLERTLLHCIRSCLAELDVLERDRRRLHSLDGKPRCG
jgi:ArsR family transcriptional regulator